MMESEQVKFPSSFLKIVCKIAKVVRVLVIILFLFGVWSSISAKPLRIEISGSKYIGIPFGVTSFHADNLDYDIAEIIKNDLQISGQFKNIQGHSMLSAEDWKQQGADLLISGNVEFNTFSVNVNFKLLDLYKDQQEATLLHYSFQNKARRNLRTLSHQISDLIFQKVTGVPGFFCTKIAYITMEGDLRKPRYNLTIADVDGHNPKTLLSTKYPLMSPSWSPDGKRIAFVSFKENRSSIKVIDVDSGEIENLTNFPGINGAPRWSPDGQQMAVVLSVDGAPKIYILSLNAKTMYRLTDGGAIDTEPCWAPNGLELYFTSNRSGNPQIYKISLETRDITRVSLVGDYNATPSITRDGKTLIMLHKNIHGSYNIAAQNLHTNNIDILTAARQDESPCLAPNGMMVLYGSKEGHNNVLRAVTLDGKFKMRVPVSQDNVKEPAWSPYLLDQQIVA
jgi:TolB protein